MSDTDIKVVSTDAILKQEEQAKDQTHFAAPGKRESDPFSSSKLAQDYTDVDDNDADDEDYVYPDLYDDDAHTPDSGSGEEGHSNEDEEHSNENSDEYGTQVEDEPINCAELYEDIADEIAEARQHLLFEVEEKRESAVARRERRLEKKKQLMDTYMMYQEILKKIKKERDYLEDHIYQFLERRELTIKSENKMTKDKKSRAERKLDLEWSKRLKEHRQKMDLKIAQKKMKKAKEAAEKERKRKEELKMERDAEEDEELMPRKSMESQTTVGTGKIVEILAKPDRTMQFSTSVMFKQSDQKPKKVSKKSKKGKRKNKAKKVKQKKAKAEKENVKEGKLEKKEKKDKCAKKNPVDNPYARQMRLLNHFAVQSELSNVRNARRIAEHQEMLRVKREEILEKRRIARRNERERKIILRIMRFLYPEVMAKIKSQKSDTPVLKIDRKKRLKAIQAKKLRNKKKVEKESDPANSKKKKIEGKITKILRKTLEKRSKISLSPAQEEYEKVLKRILQLKLFWIECGKENEVKLNKISRRSEVVEAKNKQLLEELLANLRDVSENAFYSSNLKKIPKAETNQFCSEIFKMHQKMMESSLKRHKLSKAVKVAKRQLRETQPKKKGRKDVQLLYEQLKADNHILDIKLKSKHETRDRMEYKILQVVETLAHFKEKIKFVQERLAASKTGYADLTKSVYQRRDTLATVMLEYVDTKRNERGLNAEYGILQSSRMLQDLDDTRLHCEKLRDEERDLRREYAKRLRELNNIKYQMEIMQIKSEEMKALAIQKQKDEELKAYKARMQEELDKAARRRQRMRLLDSGIKGKEKQPSEKKSSHSLLNEETPLRKSNASLKSDSGEEEEEYTDVDEYGEEESYKDSYLMDDE